jgi:hypothetical protein
MSKIVFKTDWLASNPVFYNEKTLKISHNVNDVIDYENLEFHPEGFNNYLDFGYSVFGQTPVKYVKFLRHSSEIFVKNGKLKIIEHPDPVDDWFDKHSRHTNEKELLGLIKRKIQRWERKNKGEITIPISGGFDSRLLNYFIKDKKRIKAYTYGVSPKQEDSYEIKYAQKVCHKLGINWKRIELGDFHKYIRDWINFFGISVHAHGMYHVEFYKKIIEKEEPELFLSGIIGDGWSGKVEIPPVNKVDETYLLGYTHGMNADSSFSKITHSSKIKKNYYFKNKEKLKDGRVRIIESMRMKMALLNYLLNLPKKFDFKPWSPFLDIDVALGMLNLPSNRRKDRQWQKDFFQKVGLDIENMGAEKPNKKNTLNNQAMKRIPLNPLDKDILTEFIDPEYIDWINNNVANKFWPSSISNLFKRRFIGTALNFINFKDPRTKAYSAYLTLKPIEELIKKTK